jgi:uncharacterized protein GlcG (DUF336 family)
MADLTLDTARKILDAAFAKSTELKLKPLVVTILDARGVLKLAAAQDGTSLMRAEIAHGKAYGALAMGMGSRALFQRAQEQAYFIDAVNTIAKGALVPVPGGVLIMDGTTLLGAVGVSGDTSDNDEACAVAGIQAAGLKANAGSRSSFPGRAKREPGIHRAASYIEKWIPGSRQVARPGMTVESVAAFSLKIEWSW